MYCSNVDITANEANDQPSTSYSTDQIIESEFSDNFSDSEEDFKSDPNFENNDVGYSLKLEKIEYPDISIGLSKFRYLRPLECIMAGQTGTHNICVCKMHQNVALKIHGIKRELQKYKITFNKSMGDFIKESVCELPKPGCFLYDCEECPGTAAIMKKVEEIMTENNVTQVTFSQWINTDRCDIVQISEKTEKFLEALGNDLYLVLKHDFLSKTQGAYFVEKKSAVCNGEFVVSLDFAENYTFQIQDAIQSHHWSNTQATIHPYNNENILQQTQEVFQNDVNQLDPNIPLESSLHKEPNPSTEEKRQKVQNVIETNILTVNRVPKEIPESDINIRFRESSRKMSRKPAFEAKNFVNSDPEFQRRDLVEHLPDFKPRGARTMKSRGRGRSSYQASRGESHRESP
ncbi:unnamed protein product [Brassicogethes aeneus]|uniref:Uncharacterized protein n=1 Tax=Brassicogethes aeneus TaxID=1431903 RepID=A0A9P0BIX7_BRAAE|nr:unnamed protein product [Brassicogethes aeneus]